MLSLDSAQRQLLDSVGRLPVETLSLHEAAGRWAAADVRAVRTQPPFPASAMDGYAVSWVDMPGPWRIVGESVAGARFGGTVRGGEAVRILTGAPVPDGCDTVIVQEDATRDGDQLRLTGDGPPRSGAHIRRAGLDFATGELLVSAGQWLTPARIGLLAAGSDGQVSVHRRPRVVLLSTGDELVPPGATPGPDQIISSNGVLLAALLREAGAEVTDAGIVADDAAALDAAMAAAAGCDLLVTIGGASVGDRDLVLPALERSGAMIDFWKVAIRPGKPVLTGLMGATRVIGLPGNPVSAFVCAHLFVLPVIRHMAGAAAAVPTPVMARTTVALAANGPRRDHIRARLAQTGDGPLVTPATMQDSSMLRTLADSNVLIVRPEHGDAVPAGAFVPVLSLDKWSCDT